MPGEAAVVVEEVPDAVLAEYTALEVGRQETALVVGEVLSPFVAVEVSGEDGDVGLCRLVAVEGLFHLADGFEGACEALLHFAYAYQLSHNCSCLLEGAKVRFFCDMVRNFFVWGAELRVGSFYGFGMIHAEESAAEGEADGVADAEGAVAMHAEVDGAFDGGVDVDVVAV